MVGSIHQEYIVWRKINLELLEGNFFVKKLKANSFSIEIAMLGIVL
jgi:hypothetical protein